MMKEIFEMLYQTLGSTTLFWSSYLGKLKIFTLIAILGLFVFIFRIKENKWKHNLSLELCTELWITL